MVEIPKSEIALKFDENKPPLDLIPTKALEEIAKVLDFGAQKYGRFNWAKGGFKYSRLVAAAMRHLNAYNGGESKDKETNLSHIAHACCCLLFLLEQEQRGFGQDDRHKWGNK